MTTPSTNPPDTVSIQPSGAFRLPHLLIFLLLGLLIWQTMHYYPLLPEQIAAHFDVAGNPNGFQSRTFFFGLIWAVVLVVLLAFLGIPRWLGKLNPRLLNIPNKEYWLTPARLDQAMKILSTEMGWYGVVVIGFILFTMQLALQANVARAPLNSRLLIMGLVAFLAFTVIWTIRMYRKLAVPKAQR